MLFIVIILITGVFLLSPQTNFILGPILTLTTHPEWLIFYLTPLLLIFNKYVCLAEISPANSIGANFHFELLNLAATSIC